MPTGRANGELKGELTAQKPAAMRDHFARGGNGGGGGKSPKKPERRDPIIETNIAIRELKSFLANPENFDSKGYFKISALGSAKFFLEKAEKLQKDGEQAYKNSNLNYIKAMVAAEKRGIGGFFYKKTPEHEKWSKETTRALQEIKKTIGVYHQKIQGGLNLNNAFAAKAPAVETEADRRLAARLANLSPKPAAVLPAKQSLKALYEKTMRNFYKEMRENGGKPGAEHLNHAFMILEKAPQNEEWVKTAKKDLALNLELVKLKMPESPQKIIGGFHAQIANGANPKEVFSEIIAKTAEKSNGVELNKQLLSLALNILETQTERTWLKQAIQEYGAALSKARERGQCSIF